jgi:hypothetical protein
MGTRRRIKSFRELAEVLHDRGFHTDIGPPRDSVTGDDAAAQPLARIPVAGADGYTVGRWPARGAVAALPADDPNHVLLLIDRGSAVEVKTVVERHAAVLPELRIIPDQERHVAIARIEKHRLWQRNFPEPSQPPPPVPQRPAQVQRRPPSQPSAPSEFTGPPPPEIQIECERCGITTVVHFTDARNLESILRHGLLSVRELENCGVAFFRSDTARWDDRLDAICLSIEFPNWQMFYSKRQEEGRQWAVLGIESSILWELDCAFLPDNAARSQLRRSQAHRGVEAFRNLFSDVGGRRRADLELRDCDPTHPQSEVLCFQPIPSEYIQFIHVDTADVLEWFRTHEVGAPIRVSVERKYFRPRSDWRHWSKLVAEPSPRAVSEVPLVEEDLPF